jgi:hypothetical protein
MRCKIYGERNTGTRFLSQLIKANFDVELTDRLGWKHGRINLVPEHDQVFCLTISKRPENWLVSMYRRPYEMSRKSTIKVDFNIQHRESPVQATFSEFIRAPWIAIPRDQVFYHTYPSLLELYHEKLRSYTHPLKRHHIRYEELVANIASVLAGLPLPRRAGDWRIPTRSTKMNAGKFETTEEVAARYAQPVAISEADQRFIGSRWRLLNERHGVTLQP